MECLQQKVEDAKLAYEQSLSSSKELKEVYLEAQKELLIHNHPDFVIGTTVYWEFNGRTEKLRIEEFLIEGAEVKGYRARIVHAFSGKDGTTMRNVTAADIVAGVFKQNQ